MNNPPEPKRQATLDKLFPPFKAKIDLLIRRMTARHFDPAIFESIRTPQRQKWLYGYGRTHHIGKKPKTWTMNSRHIPGKAVDIISFSRFWDWPEFYEALREEVHKIPELELIPQEICHVQWHG